MGKNKNTQVQDGQVNNGEEKKDGAVTPAADETAKTGLVGTIGQKLVDADKKRADRKQRMKEAHEKKLAEKAAKKGMPISAKIGIAAAVVGAALGGTALYVANKADDETVQLTDGEYSEETAKLPELTMVNPSVEDEPVVEAAS